MRTFHPSRARNLGWPLVLCGAALVCGGCHSRPHLDWDLAQLQIQKLTSDQDLGYDQRDLAIATRCLAPDYLDVNNHSDTTRTDYIAMLGKLFQACQRLDVTSLVTDGSCTPTACTVTVSRHFFAQLKPLTPAAKPRILNTDEILTETWVKSPQGLFKQRSEVTSSHPDPTPLSNVVAGG